jgi:transposase
MDDTDAIIAEQKQLIQRLIEENKALRALVDELREEIARLKKNSSNSSKPPSSDIVKPPKKKSKGKKRKRGGQKGQARRKSKLTLDQAQEILHHRPDEQPCPKCGTHLVPTDEKEPLQSFQYELPEQPVTLTAHVAHAGKCPRCDTVRYARLPEEVQRGGLLGPRLTAFLAMLRAEGNASISGCRKVLEAMGVEISTGAICNRLDAMSRALRETYENLATRLPHETRLNIDETTLPQDGKKLWIWAFVARDFTVFRIDPSRSAAVLEAVLGPDCRAIVGSDLYGAYTKFAKTAPILIQLCWAHLIRDLKLIADSQNKVIANYGKRMLEIAKQIFRAWHRRTGANAKRTQRRLRKLKADFLQAGTRTKAGGLARTMSERLKKEGARYFTFIDHPGLEPTNNVAEQQIRQCVLNRRVTQGVRGEKGQRFWQHTWTILATLRRRKQDAFGFLAQAASAYFDSQPTPAL